MEIKKFKMETLKREMGISKEDFEKFKMETIKREMNSYAKNRQ